ncbi:MAG: hypothetical protein KAS48_07650, partial [Gammaproteobacteria bacterium]|nr:hypothetical protein [Gammaproteobacteria bacterium]
MSIFYKINNALLATLFAAFITACGGGGGGLADIASTILSGSVGDGPIVGATVVIRSADGTVLATTASNDNANFNVSVKAKGKDYPLVIETSGGIDLVTGMAPDFDMTSIASAPSQKRVNVNPFSTMIEKVARTMPGGLRVTNIDEAKNIVLSELNFGLDASLIPDPITATITGDNVALMVKASETMAEMIRRTRDTYGSNITGSDVIDAMVADLADGKVDGSGLAGTNAHISAVSNIVTSQVLLEAMNNNLRVNGDVATNAMDYAIGVSLPGAPSTAITQNVVINQAMITQAT